MLRNSGIAGQPKTLSGTVVDFLFHFSFLLLSYWSFDCFVLIFCVFFFFVYRQKGKGREGEYKRE